jgi:hypothetical protein
VADDRPPIPCYHLRILIVANHINGKDTHVRGLKVFGPLDSTDLLVVFLPDEKEIS